jgi:hypothetical protein
VEAAVTARRSVPLPALTVALVLLGSAGPLQAQIVVHDTAVTLRNSITATLKEYLLHTQRQQHSQLRRMAQRLSIFTTLTKYRSPEAPRWRTHPWEDDETFLYANDYTAALNYGDASGAAVRSLGQRVMAVGEALAHLRPPAHRVFAAQLATVDVATASAIAATHETGQLRYNGRREQLAIEALEADVTDGSLEQSATAVLDKISGAVLIGTRQRQARTHLLAAAVEQLLLDNKRARDTEANSMNMQLVAWRHRQAANAAFAAGAGDALQVWRQP